MQSYSTWIQLQATMNEYWKSHNFIFINFGFGFGTHLFEFVKLEVFRETNVPPGFRNSVIILALKSHDKSTRAFEQSQGLGFSTS